MSRRSDITANASSEFGSTVNEAVTIAKSLASLQVTRAAPAKSPDACISAVNPAMAASRAGVSAPSTTICTGASVPAGKLFTRSS